NSPSKMSDRSYAIEEIIAEKAITRGNRAQKYYLVRWEPTWEPARRMEDQAPGAVEKYKESKKPTNGKSSLPTGRIEVEGFVDEFDDRRDATLAIRRIATDECFRMKYSELKRHHPEALIDFYEKCIVGFQGTHENMCRSCDVKRIERVSIIFPIMMKVIRRNLNCNVVVYVHNPFAITVRHSFLNSCFS
uniref:Chromo domain-containing protein n=1 Tax=Parascaris univalens TaxID=6257 RepID=A0A915B615_PARUN